MRNAFAFFRSTLMALAVAPTAMAVEHATITVSPTGVPTKSHGSAGFNLEPGNVTGEYPIRIGADASDDAAGGILINAVSELDRGGLYSTGSTVRDSSPNSNNTRSTAGALSISVTKAGPALSVDAGLPFDANLSAGYFPFAAGWQGGNLYSSTVNNNATFGALDTLVASAGIGLGAQVQTNFLDQPGVSKVTIPGVTDSNRQGILLATSASNVGRFQTVAPSIDGDGYIIRSVDNDAYFEFDPTLDPSAGGEGDAFDTPYSFVFVPVNTPGVTMASVATNGGTLVEGEQIGVPLVKSGNDFTVTSNNLTAPGRFRLEINGVTPADGTLILTPQGASEDPGGTAADNILTYESNATGWTILSQDMESDFLTNGTGDPTPLDGTGQAANGANPYFNFVFIPNTGAPTAPAAIAAPETLTNFSRSRVLGWNTDVTALSIDNGNDAGDVTAAVSGGGTEKTSGLRIDQFANRGDVAVAVDGAFLTTRDGLLLITISEGFRDNTGSGSAQEYAVGMSTAFDEKWGIVTAAADNIAGSDEFNVNYASAFFGRDSGFIMGINDDIEGSFGDPYETTKLDVDLPGVNSLTDGVLIASPFGNDDNFASATPKTDGSGWEIRVFDNTYDANTDLRTEPDAANWIYLDYDTENLVAGMVNLDGTLASSTAGAGTDWTLTKEDDGFGFAQYRLSFTDTNLNPENGMLLLTATGDAGGTENRDNSMLYETDGNDFLIRGIDHVSDGQEGAFVDYEDVAFMFAYIDFNNSPIAPLPEALAGDYNQDGTVDAADYTVWRSLVGSTSLPNETASLGVVDEADYLVWRSNFGATLGSASSTAAATVPEPMSLVLLSVSLLALASYRRR